MLDRKHGTFWGAAWHHGEDTGIEDGVRCTHWS
jgi:hypothetical protein